MGISVSVHFSREKEPTAFLTLRDSELLNINKKFQFYSNSIIRKYRKGKNFKTTIAPILIRR